jgi:hypothetical protein
MSSGQYHSERFKTIRLWLEIKTRDIEMKKKILQLGLVVITLVFGIRCETEKILFTGPYFVRFTETTDFARESHSKPINIEVHQAGTAPAQDIKVNYTIGGSAREGVDYKILGERGVVTIPAGAYVGNIQIQLINNSNNILRSQDIIFTLKSTSTPDVKVGQGESAIGEKMTFTIFDDCIVSGDYIGKRGAFSVPVDDITITSSDCEKYLLSNWNIGIFSSPFDFNLTFIDNGDNTLTIPDQESDNLPTALATINGSGILDPVTREITMTVRLVDFQNSPTVTFTLIPD